MDRRYEHPQVAELWGKQWTYDAWWRIEQAILKAQADTKVLDDDAIIESAPMVYASPAMQITPESVAVIDRIEQRTRHDVAAFVEFARAWWGEPHARWIHLGVTSSDLVDTAQGMRFKALRTTLGASLDEVSFLLGKWTSDRTPVLGRTHGQPAEPTTVAIRAEHWNELFGDAAHHLLGHTRAMQVAKVAGPVGTYAHNPPEVETKVAQALGLIEQFGGASQIVPRGNLARWASSAAGVVQTCAKIAMDLRLMNLLGEAHEPQSKGQIGSSSMAHKNNPIRAEQITGLARVAQGYATMLQPLDLWLERDISNSSVERIAVPDLWHILLHVIDQTTQLLARTQVNHRITEINLADGANAAYVAFRTVESIRDGMTAEQAREYAVAEQNESYDLLGDVRRDFLSRYPYVVDSGS